MEVRRVTNQGPQGLVEYYRDMADTWVQHGKPRQPWCMLDLLQELTASEPKLVVWGLTSHSRLSLMAEDDLEAPSLVFIDPRMDGSWHIECILPANLQPWPDAKVMGHTYDLREAVRRVHLGLQWAGLIVE